ncbi:MAG: thiolase family protein [Bacteroidetes bacterium]|nr:thiolase family protein [Bacteroidota bacterium]
MNAYIIQGYRSAVGKAGRGGFRNTSPVDLAAEVINYLLKSVPELDPKRVDDVIVGNAVPEAEQGLQMGRWVVVRSGLPLSVPGVSVNRYCGSGVETIAMAVGKIQAGFAHCIIAGGTESMSLVPTMGYKTVPNFTIAKEHPDYYIGMGLTAEEVATMHGITREQADAFSFQSHQKAIKAIEAGLFKEEIVPISVEEIYFDGSAKKSRTSLVDTDEGPRRDTSIEGLSKLKPVFKNGGQVTAGNASQTSDGASFVIVMSEAMMNELKLTPIARMVTCVSAGVNPRYMGLGPCEAVPKALKQAGLKMQDIDLIELNEAFAAQSLAVLKNLPDIDTSIVNVNGGAIALGHPLGCSGAKLSVQIFNELKRREKKYGMVTACIGGGQGIAGIYERF